MEVDVVTFYSTLDNLFKNAYEAMLEHHEPFQGPLSRIAYAVRDAGRSPEDAAQQIKQAAGYVKIADQDLQSLVQELAHGLQIKLAQPDADADRIISQWIYDSSKAIVLAMDKAKKLVLTVRVKRNPQGGFFLDIVDNGKGIPASALKDIFEPFMTSGKVGGTGIGLDVVKKNMEEQKGSVEVTRTQIGVGTTFTLRFPSVFLAEAVLIHEVLPMQAPPAAVQPRPAARALASQVTALVGSATVLTLMWFVAKSVYYITLVLAFLSISGAYLPPASPILSWASVMVMPVLISVGAGLVLSMAQLLKVSTFQSRQRAVPNSLDDRLREQGSMALSA